MRKKLEQMSKRIRLVLILALLAQTILPFLIGAAEATPTFAYTQVIFNRMQISTATTGTVCSKFSSSPGTTATTLSVVFPTGYTVSSTVGNWTVNTTSSPEWPTGSAAWTGVTAPSGGSGVVGQQVNFNVAGASQPGSTGPYCFNWTNTAAISNPSSANPNLQGSTTLAHGAYPGATAEFTSNWSSAAITSDQIAVSAIVPPTFTFTLSGTTQAFTGNLSPAATTSTATLTATVQTNAASGYACFVEDANSKTVTDAGSNPANEHGALHSTIANYNISNNTTSSLGTAAHTVTTGSEDYGFAVTAVTQGGGGQIGTGAANAAYDGTSGTKAGVLDPTQLRPFGSSTGDSNGDVYTFLERAEIAGITPAATDYADTLTVVAAGYF
ncbi:MAG: hypothetical protein ACHQUB_01850 [Candidatus Saccharimonadia bacterium]